MHLLSRKSAKCQCTNKISIKNSEQNIFLKKITWRLGEVKSNLFGQALHHPSLLKAEKQQRLHLKSLKWQMSLLNCPTDKDALSPDNLTQWLAQQQSCLSHAKVPVTNEKWFRWLTTLEEWVKARNFVCIIEMGLSVCFANTAFFSGMPTHIWNWEREELGSPVSG